MSKHTPGPWIENENLKGDGSFTGSFAVWTNSERPKYVADVPHEANARLIAAAPELLAALKDAEAMVTWAINNRAFKPDYQFTAETHIGGIRAAIAKAEGK